jgi:hypothetical protein
VESEFITVTCIGFSWLINGFAGGRLFALVLWKLLDPVPVSVSGPEKQKGVSPILSYLK